MKIVLADPAPVVSRLETNYPNLGILYLIAAAREHFKDSQWFYLPGNLTNKQHFSFLTQIKPDLYGISFTSFGVSNAFETMRQVAKIYPDLPIICGGTHASIFPEQILEDTPAQVCVIGEGEQTFLDLVKFYQNQSNNLQEIPGICFKNNGNIEYTAARELIKNLSELSFPAWDIVDFSAFLGPPVRMQKSNSFTLFSRGCPYHCFFCSNPVWRVSKPYVRLREPKECAQEVKYLYSRGLREIYIRSDEFNVDLEWSKQVLEEIISLGYRDLYFQCNLRADKVDAELAALLKKVNCWLVHIGIESANDRVLQGIGKNITVDQIKDCCGILKEEGIKIFGFLMMYQAWNNTHSTNHPLESIKQMQEKGFCWETPQEVANSLSLVRKMIQKGWLDYFSWQTATPIPGSPLYDLALKHKLMTGDKFQNMWEFPLNLPKVSKAQMQRHRFQGMLIQSWLYLRSGHIQWRHFRKVLTKIKYLIKSLLSLPFKR